jgi:cyclophilin family peptidyl-prolyl cis-trans isomerase
MSIQGNRVLLGILLLLPGISTYPQTQVLIEPVREVFIAGEPIQLRICIENLSKVRTKLKVPKDLIQALQITSPEGKVYRTPLADPETEAIDLEPSQIWGRRVDITPLIDDKQDGWHKLVFRSSSLISGEVKLFVIKDYIATIQTNYGDIVIGFFPHDAPNHVLNFVRLAKRGFYDNLTFHRIIAGFMMQGGDPKGDGTGGPGYQLDAEFSKTRRHIAGTLSMARRGDDINSAGSQFFICFRELPHLDGNYTIFGQVIKGMEVVRKIEVVKVDRLQGHRPIKKVLIKSIKITPKKEGKR